MKVTITVADVLTAVSRISRDRARVEELAREVALDRMIEPNLARMRRSTSKPHATGAAFLARAAEFDRITAEHDALMALRFGSLGITPTPGDSDG